MSQSRETCALQDVDKRRQALPKGTFDLQQELKTEHTSLKQSPVPDDVNQTVVRRTIGRQSLQ